MYTVKIYFPPNSGEAKGEIRSLARQAGTTVFHHSETLDTMRWAVYGYDTPEEAVRLLELIEQSGFNLGPVNATDLTTGEPLRTAPRS